MKDLRKTLEQMIVALSRIETYAFNGESLFRSDSMVQDAIIKNFMILGEAAKRVGATTREHFPDLPWAEMAGFRDVLIHQYDSTSLMIVWRNASLRAPELKLQLEAILGGLPQDNL
jgi:uncharacterized protein with HEPN domain